jgi:hypothetical protein
MFTFATPFLHRTKIRDPRSGIRDPGSGMNKYSDPGSGIKHPGSATHTYLCEPMGRREIYYRYTSSLLLELEGKILPMSS